MFRHHGNLAVAHFPLFCFSRPGLFCLLCSVSTCQLTFFVPSESFAISWILQCNKLKSSCPNFYVHDLCLTFLFLMTEPSLSVSLCFNSSHLKLLRCLSSPISILSSSVHSSIYVLTSLVIGAFIIVVLMHTVPDCLAIFSVFPLLSTLFFSFSSFFFGFILKELFALLPFVKSR